MKRLLLFVLVGLMFITIKSHTSAQNKENLEVILTFPEGRLGWSSVNSKDDSLLVTIIADKGKCWIYWLKDGKVVKRINDVQGGVPSPNCKYYYYYQDEYCVIKDRNDFEINRVKSEEEIESYQWSWDSKYIYISEFGLDTDIVAWKTNKIYRYDIINGQKEMIFSGKHYLNPVVVNNPNILYVMNNDDDVIIKYNIKTKQLEKVELPLDNPSLFDEFTISPDEKTIVFSDFNTQSIYFIDLKTQKILDKKAITPFYCPGNFYWKADSSYLLFTITPKEVYKYTVPKD